MAAKFNPESFVAKVVREIPRSGIREFFDIVQSQKGVISLGVGEPDFVTPWHIREAAIFALERGKTYYTSNLGLIELRRAISRVRDFSREAVRSIMSAHGTNREVYHAYRAFRGRMPSVDPLLKKRGLAGEAA